MGGKEKIAWTLLLLGFLVVEFRSLDKEHAANEELQNASRYDQEFNLLKLLLANQRDFDATMKKSGDILDTTKQVGTLAQENLESITGEGSVPCIVPQSHAVVNGRVPLVVWNRGHNNLTGVEVRLLSQAEFLDQESIFYKPPAELGTLRFEWPKSLPEGVVPILESNGVANYIAEIWTQNGYYTEVINFRRGKYTLPWAYQYWLNKQFGFPPKQSLKNELKEAREATKTCSQPKWSDDLGDGKPTPKP